jgi:hypothetical protein
MEVQSSIMLEPTSQSPQHLMTNNSFISKVDDLLNVSCPCLSLSPASIQVGFHHISPDHVLILLRHQIDSEHIQH